MVTADHLPNSQSPLVDCRLVDLRRNSLTKSVPDTLPHSLRCLFLVSWRRRWSPLSVNYYLTIYRTRIGSPGP